MSGRRSENSYSSSDDNRPWDRIIEMLDHIEKRVELLREHTAAMEQEKDNLVHMLKTIKDHHDLNLIPDGEREEIVLTTDRLLARTTTVEVMVNTPRNDQQLQALKKVNSYIDTLLANAASDPEKYRRMCETYVNACMSDALGPIDQRFQSAIIECTADDQKKIRKRLESVLTGFNLAPLSSGAAGGAENGATR